MCRFYGRYEKDCGCHIPMHSFATDDSIPVSRCEGEVDCFAQDIFKRPSWEDMRVADEVCPVEELPIRMRYKCPKHHLEWVAELYTALHRFDNWTAVVRNRQGQTRCVRVVERCQPAFARIISDLDNAADPHFAANYAAARQRVVSLLHHMARLIILDGLYMEDELPVRQLDRRWLGARAPSGSAFDPLGFPLVLIEVTDAWVLDPTATSEEISQQSLVKE